VNGRRDIRLLLTDVDGTLVTRDKMLTEATKAAAAELHDAGLALAITSGRPPRGMSMLFEPLNLQGPIAGFNGGVFVYPDLSLFKRHTIVFLTARQTLVFLFFFFYYSLI
jgi:HAD superfamily hydrolase (TIGR01484 family)